MYNEKKVELGLGKLLLAAGFPVYPENLDIASKLMVFKMLTDQNSKSRYHTLHLTLNFSSYDILDELKLKRIAHRYLSKVGLDKQPYLVYQHYDTMHAHLHIVSVKPIDGSKLLQNLYLGHGFTKASKEIEVEFGLQKAADYSVQERPLHNHLVPGRFHYGDDDAIRGISRWVNTTLMSYRFGDIMEYDAILNQFGIKVVYGREGSRMKAFKGLSYGVIKEDGNSTCCPIKAYHLSGRPLLREVEKRFTASIDSRRSYMPRMMALLENAFLLGNRKEFEDYLQRRGIRLVFNKNPEGKVYGAVYIDNGTKVAWHDFNLGENYKAAEILTIIEGLPAIIGSEIQVGGELGKLNERDTVDNFKLDLLRKELNKPIYEQYVGSELPVVDIIKDSRPYKYASYQQLAEIHEAQIKKLTQGQHRQKGLELDVDLDL